MAYRNAGRSKVYFIYGHFISDHCKAKTRDPEEHSLQWGKIKLHWVPTESSSQGCSNVVIMSPNTAHVRKWSVSCMCDQTFHTWNILPSTSSPDRKLCLEI